MSEVEKTEEITEGSACSPKRECKCKYLFLMVGVNLVFSLLTFCILFDVHHEIKRGIHRFSECRPPRHRHYDRDPWGRMGRNYGEGRHSEPEFEHSEPEFIEHGEPGPTESESE
ncbi:MAG: hypothetical protein LBB04_00960 [Oscillospiraceae bacterium]|nr:hypothetical protein [Oscillospiraceae bacterium]